MSGVSQEGGRTAEPKRKRKASPKTPKTPTRQSLGAVSRKADSQQYPVSPANGAAWHSKWEAMELDLFETSHSAQMEAPHLADLFETNRSTQGPDSRGHASPPVRNAAWQSKWDTMELDLVKAADDEFSAPHFVLPDEPQCRVSPPGRAGDPQLAKACTSDKHGMDGSLQSLGDFFDSKDAFDLCGNASDSRLDESGYKAPRRRPAANQDEPTSRLESPSSCKSASSRTPRTVKPSTPRRVQSSTPRFLLAQTYGRRTPRTPKHVDQSLLQSVRPGCWVRLQGLVGREHLNGMEGQVEKWMVDRGRWCVRCNGQLDVVCARPDNLVLLDGPSSSPPEELEHINGDGSDCDSRAKDCSQVCSESSPNSQHVSPRVSATTRECTPTGVSDSMIEQCSSRCSSNSHTQLLPKDDGSSARGHGDKRSSICSSNSQTALLPKDDSSSSEISPKVVSERDNQENYAVEEEVGEHDVAAILACDESSNLRSAARTHEDVEVVLHSSFADTKESAKAIDILPGAPAKAIKCFWYLFYTLVLLCFFEFVLLGTSVALDRFWSPCREQLKTCHNLHINDCDGLSCKDGAPFFSPLWPMSSLVFTAIPIRIVLGSASGTSTSSWPRCMLIALLISVAVAGGGAATLSQMTGSGIHYAARCPMERSVERCGAHVCPSPCSRKSNFSPCTCGLLGEDEMARALFLSGAPACHPYEWYSWQMEVLEELLLKYETFACVFGPLGCAALVIGGMLLLVQVCCCPVLLFGSWGLHLALLVLFTPASTERAADVEIPREIGRRQAVEHDDPVQHPEKTACSKKEQADDAVLDEREIKSEAV